LKTRIPSGERYFRLRSNLEKRHLATICQAARCPNIAECWQNNHATFLVMGEVCTRNCGFCAVPHGIPRSINPREIEQVKEMIGFLELKYAVITSVTRDDLPDGGSRYLGRMIRELKALFPGLKLEILIPDFAGDRSALQRVLAAGPQVLNHNLETVRSLYPRVNRPAANYQRSLDVLEWAKEDGRITKSGIMVGLGESGEELRSLFRDLRKRDVDLLTIGQYLQPTRNHLPVKKYYPPEDFTRLKREALTLGFSAVESGPFVRSSYHAREMYEKREKVSC